MWIQQADNENYRVTSLTDHFKLFLPKGLRLLNATGISADGTKIVGIAGFENKPFLSVFYLHLLQKGVFACKAIPAVAPQSN